MADLKKLKLSGITYNLVDASALHTLDSTVTSGGTNAVQGSGIYNAITASTAAALETVSEAGYQTSQDVQDAISGKADTTAVTQDIAAAVSGKLDTSTYETYTGTTVPSLLSDKADVTALTSFFGAVDYDSNTKHINFYNESTTGTVLAYVDATDFIKDGMVDNVEIKTISGASYLAITFNSDAGKEEIDIPLTDIFDPSNYYDKDAVDEAISAATSGKVDTSVYTAYTAATDTVISGKQDELTAGAGIDITNNVVSVTGIPLTVDDTVTSGSSNPVKSSGIYNAITAATATKQDTLVSGTNIKTVGTETILGSGNIALMTAHVGTGDDSETLILDFA